MSETIDLLKVKHLPKELESGILYVSKKYGVAGHLCPCGCKSKIITPLDSFEWKLTVKRGKPSLFPSVGNWQLDCKSHYWILDGRIQWSSQWSNEEISEGQEAEDLKRKLHFEKLNQRKDRWTIFKKLFNYFMKLRK